MRLKTFPSITLAAFLAITCTMATPVSANASTWKVKPPSGRQDTHIYSVDPSELTLSPPSRAAQEKAYPSYDPYLQQEIDWDNLDAANIDRVFDSSNIPVDIESQKRKPPQEEAKTRFIKQNQKKPTLELFQSLIAEDDLPNLSSPDKDYPTVEEVLQATKGPKSFVSKGKMTRLNDEKLLAQIQEANQSPPHEEQTVLINFNNVSIIEYIRHISRISNRNFIFSEEDLQFTVTIVSEETTTLENVLMALFQELHVRGLSVIEEGNTFIIHRTDSVRAPGTIVSETYPQGAARPDIITRVFRLNVADATAVSGMVRPMLSDKAILQVLPDTNHLVLTDIASNVEKVMQLIRSVDAPNSSMVVGQYVVRNSQMDTLITNAEQIMTSIARGQPITFVAHGPSNSVFIIASPFLVERAIPVLQRLDQNDGTTGIFDLNELKYVPPTTQKELDELKRRALEGRPEEQRGVRVSPGGEMRILPGGTQVFQAPAAEGFWRLDANGNWIYEPVEVKATEDSSRPPEGYWKQDFQNHWEFIKGAVPPDYKGQLLKRPDGTWENLEMDTGPLGKWQYSSDGQWRFLLRPGASIFAGKRIRASQIEPTLPLGAIERTRFYIHKLQYRKGDSLQIALQQIASSLGNVADINPDLIQAIESIQWLEPSNSLIVTGTAIAILKVKELIDEIDKPLRQVFIEMLIMDLAIDESLDLGVTWGTRFGGGNTAGAQAFIAGATPVGGLLRTAGAGLNVVPDAGTILSQVGGYNFGVVGRKLSADGTTFQSFGTFLHALHEKSNVNVLLNPKILTEDNLTAELFVGENTPFKTQSIANDQGSTITSNFEFKDVGLTLLVTPYLGNSNIVTLDIEFEQSSITNQNTAGGTTNEAIGPTTRINRTKTRIHMPDGFFLVISGLIQDTETHERRHVPCLGGVPLIGAAFTDKHFNDQKRNLMLFLRPQLIDTEIQMDNLTEHQQNIFRVKSRTKKMWKMDYEETLDWLNAIQTDPNNNENECCQENDVWPHRPEHRMKKRLLCP